MHITGFHKNVYIMYLFIYLFKSYMSLWKGSRNKCPLSKNIFDQCSSSKEKKKTCILTKVGFQFQDLPKKMQCISNKSMAFINDSLIKIICRHHFICSQLFRLKKKIIFDFFFCFLTRSTAVHSSAPAFQKEYQDCSII